MFFSGVISMADLIGDILHHAGCAFLRGQGGVDPFVPQIALAQRTRPFFFCPGASVVLVFVLIHSRLLLLSI